jgi:hypothetical protein
VDKARRIGAVKAGVVLILGLTFAACHSPPPPRPKPNPAGLVTLTCGKTGPIAPTGLVHCLRGRNYVTPPARAALINAAARIEAQFPGSRLLYMEASWASGKKPMPPHLSHGDGRQIDLAMFYQDRAGKPLTGPPTLDPNGYGAYEPPRTEAARACAHGERGWFERPDPPKSRNWRLDEARTRLLIRTLAGDPRVRRIFVEPHLKARLGFAANGKVRFAGCGAARHDDHIHVDFY